MSDEIEELDEILDDKNFVEDEKLKNIPMPPGAKDQVQIVVKRHPKYKPKRRWQYRMEKREYKSRMRIIALREIGDSANRRKAYIRGKLIDYLTKISWMLFLVFVSYVAPSLIPIVVEQVMSNLPGSG
jgi:hypothetical protein